MVSVLLVLELFDCGFGFAGVAGGWSCCLGCAFKKYPFGGSKRDLRGVDGVLLPESLASLLLVAVTAD